MNDLQRIGGAEEELILAAVDAIKVPATRAAYATAARDYLEFRRTTGGAFAESLTAWKAAMKQGGKSPATINIRLSGMKYLLRQAVKGADATVRATMEQALREQPGIKKVRQPVSGGKLVTHDEVAKIIAVMSDRGAGFCRFLYYTGCRVSEMLGIRLSDCRGNGTVSISVVGKGDKSRVVEIPRELFEQLKGIYGGGAWLFETSAGTQYTRSYVSAMIARAAKRALGKDRVVSAHSLRHSFATRMVAGGKIQGTSTYLGHARTSTTLEAYTHETITAADLAGGLLP